MTSQENSFSLDFETSPMGTLVPLNKIIRCRWRDEDDSGDKVKDNIERIGEHGFTRNLQGMRLDTIEKLVQYLMVADDELYSTPELAYAKAVTMPLDLVEQWVGHHRREACRQLGTWHIWTLEHLGKRDLIPFILKDCSDNMDEARSIYLGDNKKGDHQLAGWAIGNVRKMLPELLRRMPKSEAYAYLAREMGLQPIDIEKLAEIVKSLAAGIITPHIKRLIPDNAIEFHRKLIQTLNLTPVSLELQKDIVDESMRPDCKNPRKSIGNAFSAIIAALPQPEKPVVKKTKKPFADVLLQLGYKFVTALQQPEFEDVEDAVKQRINEYALIIAKLTAVTPSEEDIEADELIAEIRAEEVQESYDATAGY